LDEARKRILNAPQKLSGESDRIERNLADVTKKIKFTFIGIKQAKGKIRELEKKLPPGKDLKTRLTALQKNFDTYLALEETEEKIEVFIKPDVEKSAEEMAKGLDKVRRKTELPVRFPALFSEKSASSKKS
jgi:hypothetical protein